uniref:Endonuclease/exonuclease/phosphatase domain-containing protein n=1 Tax=Aureoumbra lagunensis TaxID=44058 RepID=A0A6S8CBA3_9STRA|mmetsp:Transcript_18681/g.28158  ORF Transcript_18681/g.28158 Transcript_18681/m.28158 type:complete len:337 (-) Transcript_18681:18-1028(-)
MIAFQKIILFSFVIIHHLALQKVRVVQWNIHAWRDSEHRDNYEELATLLEELEPDILLLNEVLHPFAPDEEKEKGDAYFAIVKAGKGRGLEVEPCLSTGTKSPYLDRLAKRLKLNEVYFAEAESDHCFFGKLPFGSALCSRFPLKNSGQILMQSTSADLTLGSQARDFVENRGAVWGTVCIHNAHEFIFATAHLDHKSEELREKQMLTCLNALPANVPILLAGDFNTFQRSDHSHHQWSKILSFYASRGWPQPSENSLVLDLLRQRKWTDVATLFNSSFSCREPTCWTHCPLFRIDHAWLSSDCFARNTKLQLNAYKVYNNSASDHFPIVLDLTLL